MSRFKSTALRYGFSVGLFAAAIGISLLLQKYSIKINLTILIMGVIFLASWYGGRGPGILTALLLEMTTIIYTPIPPDSSIAKAWFGYFSVTLLLVSFALLISGRRRVEQRLREQGELLTVTLKSIGDAVIATDLDGRISFANPVSEHLTGWTAAEMVGKPLNEIFKIINEESRQPVESPFTAIVRRGATVGLANHTLLVAKDGAEIPIEDSGAPIRDAKGKVVGAIIVFHDVSERRAAEREREQLLMSEQAARREAESAGRLKDEFLATISHELRTPLSAILGWAAMLKNNRLEEPDKQKALEVIERNAKAQGEIIGDLLDISQIITGKFSIAETRVEMTSVIRQTVESLNALAASKAIALEISVDDESAGLIVLGDAERLHQIVWNLASNAIKFTPEGGGVELRAQRTSAGLELTVTDSGIGIDAKFLPFVFEHFRQGDPSPTRAYGGLGLGLSIVRHLVRLHGGEISAASDGVGRGAVFTVRLPLAAEEEEKGGKETEEKSEMGFYG
jgi:PAS domain S-box-containing protein